MATATRPKSNVQRPKSKKPRTIAVVEDGDVERENERHNHLVATSIERLKRTSQWAEAETEAGQFNDHANELPAEVGFAGVDVERILRHKLATLFWPSATDPELRGNSDGVMATAKDGQRAQLSWSDLVDELEEAMVKPVKKNGEASAEQVEVAGKRKPANVVPVHGDPTDWCNLLHPGVNSTSVPGGIAANDPDVAVPAKTNGSARKRKAKPDAAAREEAPVVPDEDVHRAQRRGADYASIAVSLIEPNPYQPRRDFPAAEIAELAASIEAHDLLQPIAVRQKPGLKTGFEPVQHQIVDGERRWRAFQKLGRKAIPIVHREVSDAEMATLALVANDDRKDLTAIERAAAYRRMIKDFGLTHEQLAAKLGRSKGYVSNLVRLLDLPVDWQARVAAGELSPSHAELVVPWATYPEILKQLADQMKEGVAPLREFEDDVRHATMWGTKSLTEKEWSSATCGYIDPPKWTPEQLDKLRVIQVKGFNGKLEKRATNVKAWTSIWSAHKAKHAPKKKKKGQATDEATAKREATAAAKQAQRQFEEKLANWKVAWYATLAAEAIDRLSDAEVVRVLLWASLDSDSPFMDAHDTAAKLLKIPAKRTWDAPWHEHVAKVKHTELPGFVRRMFRSCLIVDGKPRRFLRADEMEKLLAVLSIDPATEWKQHLAGKWTKPYLELHSVQQLSQLVFEYEGIGFMGQYAKPKAVSYLQSMSTFKSKLPRELMPEPADGKAKKGGR